MYFDTHAHYDDERFNEDRDALLPEIHAAGVDLILNPGCDIPTSRLAVSFAHKYPFMYAAVGFHPHSAKEMDDAALAQIEELARDPKVKAIGEIGLDYFYDFSPRDVQKDAFRRQLKLAEKLNLPVVIHERDACADCLEIIRDFAHLRGVYHCFSGSWETAQVILDMGWYLSFTGAATFKNARKAPEVLANMPLDRLMIETDSPYMAPVPVRGTRNDSRNLQHIAAAIEKIRGVPADKIAQVTAENGKRFFGID